MKSKHKYAIEVEISLNMNPVLARRGQTTNRDIISDYNHRRSEFLSEISKVADPELCHITNISPDLIPHGASKC